MKATSIGLGVWATALGIAAEVAVARPKPDRIGICYTFAAETLAVTQPCVISTGYGTGIHYVVLHWTDGTTTQIQTDMSQQAGFTTVDEQPAQTYLRDASFYNPVSEATDEDVIYCERVVSTNNSVCYKFTD